MDLPDDAAGIVIHGYCDAGDWETALIVTSRPDSRSARIGRLLDVPVLPSATRESLARCDRVVVGSAAPETWAGIADLLVGLPVEMLPLAQVMGEMGRPPEGPDPPAAPIAASIEAQLPQPSPASPESEPASPEPEPRAAPLAPGSPERLLAPEPPVKTPAPESPVPPASEPRASRPPARSNSEVDAGPAARAASAQSPAPPAAEATRPSPDPEPSGFHAATILGAEIAGQNLPLHLDPEDRRVVELLRTVLQSTRARTASLMLLDARGTHLRVAAAQGHHAAEIREIRQEPGAGLAGRAFSTGQPQISRGVIPCLAEQVGNTRYRVSVSCPVVLANAPIGVLSINGELLEEIPDAEILRSLRRHLSEACLAVLSAVRIERIEEPPSQTALQCLVDRLMSLEESLSARIGFLAEALGKVLEADYAHAFLVDPMSGRLVALGAPAGMTAPSERTQPISRGLFGWVARHGIPQALESVDADGADRVATICYPIVSTHPHSLIVLESVPLRRMTKSEVVRLLAEIVEQVEGMIAVEEAMAIQDLVADLGMRIADQTADLDRLPPYHQTQALLELALELTTAEAAVWIPSPGASPVMSRPATRRAAGVLLEVWNHLEPVAAWVRERGAAASGFSGEGWDEGAAGCPLPYIGVHDAGREGALLVFFSAQESAGAPAQVPLHVLWKVLQGICEKMPKEGSRLPSAVGRPREVGADQSGGFVASLERFAERVRAEQLRSRHTGRPFALGRVRLASDASPAEAEALRAFLQRTRREIDEWCEPEPGTILLLWPEPDSDPESVLSRLFQLWASERPSVPWDASHRVLTGREEETVGGRSWIEELTSVRARA